MEKLNKSSTKSVVYLLALLLGLSGCSFKAQVIDLDERGYFRETPDFSQIEEVKTSNGYVLKATVGEITTKTTTPEGYEFEGVLFE